MMSKSTHWTGTYKTWLSSSSSPNLPVPGHPVCSMWTIGVHSEAFCEDKHMKTQSELRSCTVKDKASVKQNL